MVCEEIPYHTIPYTNMTVGKTYDVLEFEAENDYVTIIRIVDDFGKGHWYDIKYFTNLSDWRDQQINKILE